jgi:putative serine protease PepD
VDVAKTISSEIIATGRVTHSYFGVRTAPISAESAAAAGVPVGLFVAGVMTGGPAASAGLRPGDVITKIDGQDATTNLQLQELTLTKKPGDAVALEFTRDGKQTSGTVTLGAQP